jgi:hypothetical protein
MFLLLYLSSMAGIILSTFQSLPVLISWRWKCSVLKVWLNFPTLATKSNTCFIIYNLQHDQRKARGCNFYIPLLHAIEIYQRGVGIPLYLHSKYNVFFAEEFK